MSSENEITDADYWDGFWEAGSIAVRPVPDSAPVIGLKAFWFRDLERRIGSMRGARVLELGGAGVNVRLLLMCKWGGADVSVVDFSAVGLRILEELFEQNGASVKTHMGDFMAESFVGGTYDIITHWGVLEHFNDPVPILKACAQRLNSGGTMVFSMPNMEAWAARYWRELSPENWSAHIFHSEETMRSWCEEGGFEVIDFHYAGPAFFNITPFEVNNWTSKLLSLANRLTMVLSQFLPFVANVRNRHFGKERVFVLRKAS